MLEALKAEGVFVREVDTLGIAYHSPALDAFSDELRTGSHPCPAADIQYPGRRAVIQAHPALLGMVPHAGRCLPRWYKGLLARRVSWVSLLT